AGDVLLISRGRVLSIRSDPLSRRSGPDDNNNWQSGRYLRFEHGCDGYHWTLFIAPVAGRAATERRHFVCHQCWFGGGNSRGVELALLEFDRLRPDLRINRYYRDVFR